MSLTADQQAFAQYIAGLWEQPEVIGESRGFFPEGSAADAGLLHSYHISQRPQWKRWRLHIAFPVQHWWCHSLWEAFDHYSWSDPVPPKSFQCIAARLRNALAVHDQVAARSACLDIFGWGGVAKSPADKSRIWVEDQFQQKTLRQSIMQAVQLLQPDSAQGLAAFDGKGLLMNSAMTKVYAAADPDNVIIYDGRVGAALGLLVRYWLMRTAAPCVPADLAFRWGEGRGEANRNPSLYGYKFPKLNSSQCQSWANQVLLAGRLLKQVMHYNPAIGSITELEKALFMIGYNVDIDLPPQVLHVGHFRAPTTPKNIGL